MIDTGKYAGISVNIARHGKPVAFDTFGYQDVDARKPIRRDTIFRIASMSKPIAAVAALILIEECVVRLDDPVDDILPELADRQVLADPSGPLDKTVLKATACSQRSSGMRACPLRRARRQRSKRLANSVKAASAGVSIGVDIGSSSQNHKKGLYLRTTMFQMSRTLTGSAR